jgi:hypothetical protein
MYTCEICEKQYRHRGSLTHHLRGHQGVNFTCNTCKVSFRRNSYLKKHKCSPEPQPAATTEEPTKAPSEYSHQPGYITIQVKVNSDQYTEFLEFMRACPFIYQEDSGVLTTDPPPNLEATTDTLVPECSDPPSAPTSIQAPVDVLMSPTAMDYLDSPYIPTARDILDGPQSQMPEVCIGTEGGEDGWMPGSCVSTQEPFGTTLDLELFEEYISSL